MIWLVYVIREPNHADHVIGHHALYVLVQPRKTDPNMTEKELTET